MRLGARSTSVRARLDPTQGSTSLLTFLCWILSDRQSLAMCNKLMQHIRYLGKCFNALPKAFENLLKTESYRASYNRMFSIRAAKTCQKFEIPHAWSASM
jgi:hypothetical protein